MNPNTNYLDIWIKISPENAANLLQALEQLGFGSLGLKLQDLADLEKLN